MKTIALRFLNKFAPDCGTIEAHNEMIQERGYVWYGKLGNKIAPRDIMSRCTVASSGQELGVASKHSMSPYFKIIAPDTGEE